MKARHKRAEGGRVKAYDAEGSNVEKEAKERKRGGKVEKPAMKRDEHRVEGKMAKMRLDRPARKAGGRVGADKSPLSSAHGATAPMGHKTDD